MAFVFCGLLLLICNYNSSFGFDFLGRKIYQLSHPIYNMSDSLPGSHLVFVKTQRMLQLLADFRRTPTATRTSTIGLVDR